MKSLSLDLETYSSCSLQKSGVYRYVEASDFEILLFGYSIDAGPVQVIDIANGEKIPTDILDALTDDSVIKWAFNANFERICLSQYLKAMGRSLDPFHDNHSLSTEMARYLNPAGWRCTMIWAATMGLPLSLEGVGAVLGLEKQKLTEGKELIKLFCQPCAPTKRNGGRSRILPADEPNKWAAFKRYNARDVETELSIQARLHKFPVPDFIWDEYHIDQEINDRGVQIDLPLVQQAISMDARSRSELTEVMQRITELDNPNSVQQMKQWLSDNGMEADSLGKKVVAELIKGAPPELQRILILRQQLAKSSVKKYQSMANAVCADGRARGMFQFYGSRTGRWAGRLIQMQNLPQNHLPDLAEARALVIAGDYAGVEMLYEDVPDTLSQLIRTAFIPKSSNKFIVSDFSAIEARVIAWLAGETWRQELFARGGDIYCQSASQMFKVPVEKHGINGHLRQKGKIAELACIAEGQLVLTNHGEKPIEKITTDDLLWDGESWVQHEGVVYKGIKEVITYEGLTATPDHLVWIEGKSKPVQLGFAAARSSHLLQTGDGGTAVRLGKDYQLRETLEFYTKTLLHADEMHWMWGGTVADPGFATKWKISRMPGLFKTAPDSKVAGSETYRSETAMRKPKGSRVFKLRWQGDPVSVREHLGSRALLDTGVRDAGQGIGAGSNRHKWALRTREYSLCNQSAKSSESEKHSAERVRSGVLAIYAQRCCSETFTGDDQGQNYSRRGNVRIQETKELASHQCTARLYDIRNAGPHHRFTVSGKLVHNCGYGGSIGALKAMGALEMGLQEEELAPLVQAWRASNPNIVKLWWDVDNAARTAIRDKTAVSTHGITFTARAGMLFITLPSGRNLAYVKPKICTNRFGGECISFEGTGSTKKWDTIDTYGPKLVENIVQAISRDILCYAMKTLRCCNIVMHIHDELVIEADPSMSLDSICEQMGRTPPWADGLLLKADGFETEFYKKD